MGRLTNKKNETKTVDSEKGFRLSGLFLVPDLPKARDQSPHRPGKHGDQPGKGRGDSTDDLSHQHILRGKIGQCVNLTLIQGHLA